MEEMNIQSIFTTSSKKYFRDYGLQLAESLYKKTGTKLIVYSEDNLEAYDNLIKIKPLKHSSQLSQFQLDFREHYGSKYQFLPYLMKMDVWAFKIAAQLQHIEENPLDSALYLDSDSVVLKRKFISEVNYLAEKSKNVDCGLFRRRDNFLHPETGFIIFNNSTELHLAYLDMYRKIISGEYVSLPSWTDSSLIDDQIERRKISYIDFCEELELKSSNPIYESNLKKSFIHLKGRRKGRYSRIKFLIGRYR
jgi:hypothetical protein